MKPLCRREKLVILIGALLLAMMGIFPPWVGYYETYSGALNVANYKHPAYPIGYAPIFSPPKIVTVTEDGRYGIIHPVILILGKKAMGPELDGAEYAEGVEVDTTRLLIQWAVVLVITGAILAAMRSQEKQSK